MNNCHGVDVTCGNSAQQSVTCDFHNLAGKLAQLVTKETAAVQAELAKDLQSPPDEQSISQKMESHLTNSCSAGTLTNQTFSADVVCNFAKRDTLNLLNSVDQSTACLLGVTRMLIDNARVEAARKQVQKKDPFTNPGVVALFVVGGVVWIGICIGVFFGVWIPRGNRAKRRP
jgi:hypothetical protein